MLFNEQSRFEIVSAYDFSRDVLGRCGEGHLSIAGIADVHVTPGDGDIQDHRLGDTDRQSAPEAGLLAHHRDPG